MVKTIRCYTHSPFRRGDEISWADVWLKYKVKRKIKWLSPLIGSKNHADQNLWFANHCYEQYGEDYLEDVKDCESILEDLKTNEFVMRGEGSKLEIYTNKEWLDLAEAKKMLFWLLAQHGITDCKLVWKKEKNYVYSLG